MPLTISLTNVNLSETDIAHLKTTYLDGATVAVSYSSNVAQVREAMVDAILELIEDRHKRSTFRTAIYPWRNSAMNTFTYEKPRQGLTTSMKVSIDVTRRGSSTKTSAGALSVGIFNFEPDRDEAVEHGLVHPDAVREIGALSRDMRAAVLGVFNRQREGRTSPGTTRVNHIHVGGRGTENLLFHVPSDDTEDWTIVGVVNEHMEGAVSTQQQACFDRASTTELSRARAMRVSERGLVNA